MARIAAEAVVMAHGPLGSVQGEPAKRFRPDRRIRRVTSPQFTRWKS